MPRRRRAFIARTHAQTFEVIYKPLADRPGVTEPVLRAVRGQDSQENDAPGAPGSSVTEEFESAADLEDSYVADRVRYELGEYGFPDDGYNYAKHFRTIGSGESGAVFISKDGGTDASAISEEKIDPIKLGEEATANEDEKRKQREWEQIQRRRAVDPDLDEVFAALEDTDDSEDEAQKDPAVATDQDGYESAETSGAGLEDDFVWKALGAEDDFPALSRETLAQSRESNRVRTGRLLDDQFESLVASYGADLENSEDDADFARAEDCSDNYGNDDDDDPNAIVGGVSDDGATEDLSDDGYGEYDAAAELERNADFDEGLLAEIEAELPTGLTRTDNDLDGAMDSLIGQYKRTTIDDVYSGPDSVRAPEALEGVRKAAARHFDAPQNAWPEKSAESLKRAPMPSVVDATTGSMDSSGGPDVPSAKVAPHAAAVLQGSSGAEAGDDDDNNDDEGSSSDEAFEDIVVRARVNEKWDCETILSTYSNLDNHPSVIDDGPGARRPHSKATASHAAGPHSIIRLDPRLSAPADYLPAALNDATAGGAQDSGRSHFRDHAQSASTAHVAARDKNESSEEKRQRKAAAKAAARERREAKKEMRKAFGAEHVKQGGHASKIGRSKVAVRF